MLDVAAVADAALTDYFVQNEVNHQPIIVSLTEVMAYGGPQFSYTVINGAQIVAAMQAAGRLFAFCLVVDADGYQQEQAITAA